ncbi:uroporphyrinogen decarboxylase [Paenibacillus forsythiae]|uniref:Uroporphyrinogen decarboxylase n=1 Tax=Paenibacillus forsythiae TaxID=365616 RepID=A0ABU3H671_9BACL|nr:uroporphyrinogen decarboxylase family protein [Paenibacillus forsythiae]MDT3426216.1 uroporphyrinogen decarboxylase [Paenibacillus forsythiae]
MRPYERLKAMLEGRRIDRPGAALWKHISLVDRDPVEFVNHTIRLQESNDWDFVKLGYNGFYFVEGWGAQLKWPKTEAEANNMYSSPPYLKYVIDDPCEWDSFKPISVKTGPLAREIEATKRIVDRFKGDVPVLPTIFSPLTSAQEMTGSYVRPHMMMAQLRYHPERVHKALGIITEVTLEFIEELIKAGVDGVFFATQFALADLISPAAHSEFGRAYDLAVLNALKGRTWFNMVHLHGTGELMFDEIKDYPIQAFNWEDRRTSLSLKKAREKTDKILIGGIEQVEDFLQPDRAVLKERMRDRIQDALEQTGDNKLIIAPGCTVPSHVPESSFGVLKEAVEEFGY